MLLFIWCFGSSYVKDLPSAVRYSKGQLDEFTRSLVESKAINAPINDYNFDPRGDGQEES